MELIWVLLVETFDMLVEHLALLSDVTVAWRLGSGWEFCREHGIQLNRPCGRVAPPLVSLFFCFQEFFASGFVLPVLFCDVFFIPGFRVIHASSSSSSSSIKFSLLRVVQCQSRGNLLLATPLASQPVYYFYAIYAKGGRPRDGSRPRLSPISDRFSSDDLSTSALALPGTTSLLTAAFPTLDRGSGSSLPRTCPRQRQGAGRGNGLDPTAPAHGLLRTSGGRSQIRDLLLIRLLLLFRLPPNLFFLPLSSSFPLHSPTSSLLSFIFRLPGPAVFAHSAQSKSKGGPHSPLPVARPQALRPSSTAGPRPGLPGHGLEGEPGGGPQ